MAESPRHTPSFNILNHAPLYFALFLAFSWLSIEHYYYCEPVLDNNLDKKTMSTSSNDREKEAPSKQTINTPKVGKCQSGPYIYDPCKHMEGIGSTFQHRKYSLIFADALKGMWIGQLYNQHELETGNHAYKYFGLGDENCQEKDLFKNSTSFLNYVYTNHSHILFGPGQPSPKPLPDIKELCLLIQKNQTLFHLDAKLRNTVFVIKCDVLRQNLNYCLFNPHFRNRYYSKQIERGVPLRARNELWISVHFRWGDVATQSVFSPDQRAGAGLQKYVQATDRARKFLSDSFDNRSARIHFFSEGNPSQFSSFSETFPDASFNVNSNWTSTIDTMSQSQVLIGGQSSFFVLGSLLCRKCSVMTFSPKPKFEVLTVEGLLSSHVNVSNLRGTRP